MAGDETEGLYHLDYRENANTPSQILEHFVEL